MKNKKNKAFTLIEILIYATLLSLVTLFLIQIVIYYNQSSRTIDQINALQIRINAALTILDYDFTNAGYTALQDGVVLSRFFFVNANGQVVDNNTASDVRKIILQNNQNNRFVDRISFNYFELEENNLAFISNATLLGRGNSTQILIRSVNMNNTPGFQNVWPNPNPNDLESSAYPVIAYAPDADGNFIGVLFYITHVQYAANHMQHRPVRFYDQNLNRSIVTNLPRTTNVSLIRPRNIFRLNYFVDNNGNLIREVYNFRTDNPFTRDVILTNVESFNIEVALDQDNDNQPDLDNNQEIRWIDSIPNGLEDRVAMLRYTIVLRSNIRTLMGLERNPLTNEGGDGFRRLMLFRTVTLRNIVNPSI